MKRKFEIECGEEIDFEKLVEDIIEKVKGGYNCNLQYAKHAKKLKEKGIAKSTNEAAKIISNETGESQGAVRQKILRGEVVHTVQETQPAEITCSEPQLSTRDPLEVVVELHNVVLDKDSKTLYHLKRYWKQASKKDKKNFRRWIDEIES